MIDEKSNYYFMFQDEIEDRIDFRFNHPFFDRALAFIMRKGTEIDDDLITFIGNGSTPNKLLYEDIPDTQKVLFIKNENVKPLFLNLENKYYVFRSDYESSHKNLHVMKNDVLFSMTGTLGNACLIHEYIEATINQNVVILRFNEDKLDPEYAVRFLNSSFIELQIKKNFTSGQTPYLNEDKIKDLKIIVLPKPIQHNIVRQTLHIESQASDFESKVQKFLVQTNKFFLDKLGIDLPDEEISYFFKKGKENRSNYYYKFSEEIGGRFHYLFNHPKLEILEILKNKYQTVLLKTICREPIKRGEQPEYSDSGVMVIKTVDLKNRFIDYKNTLRVSEDFYESKPQAHIRKDDILVSSTGYVSVGKIDVFDIDELALADGHISIVRLNGDYDPYFVTYFLRSALGQLQFEKWFTGSSGQIEVQPEDLNKFILPSKDSIPKEKQKEIADKITKEYQRALDYEQQSQSKWQEAKELFKRLILEGVENG